MRETLAILLLVSMGVNALQWMISQSLAENNALTRAHLAACDARKANLLEDLESDGVIDSLPDSGLIDVPSGWLMPQTAD